MFHGTPRSHIVLGIVNQLSKIQKDLLCNQELEREAQEMGIKAALHMAKLMKMNLEKVKKQGGREYERNKGSGTFKHGRN